MAGKATDRGDAASAEVGGGRSVVGGVRPSGIPSCREYAAGALSDGQRQTRTQSTWSVAGNGVLPVTAFVPAPMIWLNCTR